MRYLFVLITFIISLIPIFSEGVKYDPILRGIHLCIVLVCSISLFLYRDRPYSLFKIVHLFFLFFLCIAPIMQHQQNIVLWGGGGFSDDDYLITSSAVLFIVLLYNSIYSYIIGRKDSSFHVKKQRIVSFFSNPIVLNRKLNMKEEVIFILISICILLIVFKLHNNNVYALFLRGGELTSNADLIVESSISQSVSLLINNFLRPMGAVLFLSAYKLGVRHKIVLYTLFLLMVLMAFPLAMPRFWVAAVYIPILLTTCKIMKRKDVFVLTFVLGLLIVFPFLNEFRNYEEGQNITFKFNFDMFLEGHFDSYSSLMRVMINDVVTYGDQLFGSLFFWVPRDFWLTKPIGSGAYLSEVLYLDFSNISCCYFAEGYINGGIVGLFFFVVFLAWITAMLDRAYWKVAVKLHKTFFDIFYFISIGMLFFILRGDLLSSTAFTFAFLLACMTIYLGIYLMRTVKIVIKSSKVVTCHSKKH